jgi:hypothetical protein
MDRGHQPVTSRQIASALLLSGIMSFLTYRKFRACTAKSDQAQTDIGRVVNLAASS